MLLELSSNNTISLGSVSATAAVALLSAAAGARVSVVPWVVFPLLLGITVVVQAYTAATTLTAGGKHTCALRFDGRVVCWGTLASPFSHHFVQLSAGFEHTCGLRSDGAVTCWGHNDLGQAAPPSGGFTEVSAGQSHTCGIRPGGRVECWGDGSSGQAAPPDGPFTHLSAGSWHTCGVRPGAGGAIGCFIDH
ncbi:hypothetical protein BH20PSE1_BH20PSE1_08610 [soil metagenome]